MLVLAATVPDSCGVRAFLFIPSWAPTVSHYWTQDFFTHNLMWKLLASESVWSFAEAKRQIWHFIIISSQKDSLPHSHDYKQMILYFRSSRTFFLHRDITDQLVEMSWRLGFQLHLEVLRAGMVKPDAEVQVRKLCIVYAWTKLNQSSVRTERLFTV